MSATTEGLRKLCHALYEPHTAPEVYRHVSDLADAASFIQQAARQCAQQLHALRLAGDIGVDSLPSSFNDPTASAISLLADANGRASDLYVLLDRAGQAASHLTSKEAGE